ncbi:hypothetical protein TP2_14450 [Thioclava pacifica DSM 10166]|uniref:HPr kinase/phosphorylase C-terminal domain-containing protein n=1 Tax=Thioclava pacifica DSM 10166 TaxID=1353537 RepID=A0A074J4I1_9RHOB|nr:hypothetical protein TP2_14450 [Thioclava pacifica DSM 10166]
MERVRDASFDRSDVAAPEQIRIWEKAGLFQKERYQPEAYLALTETAEPRHISFGFGHAGITIALPDQILAKQLRTILAPILIGPDGRDWPVIEVACAHGEFTVFEAGHPTTERIDRDQTRFLLIRRIAEILLGENSVAAILHASAVARDGRCLVLTGDSGRGKTTSAIGLLNAGCIQVSDDHLALDRNGCDALAFPAAIGIKPGSVDLPEVKALLAASHETAPVREGVRYAHAPNRAAPGTRFPIAAIVMPHFVPGAELELERLSPEAALVEIISAGARLSPGINSIRPVAHLLNEVPVYVMRYGKSAQSVPACLSLLESPC